MRKTFVFVALVLTLFMADVRPGLALTEKGSPEELVLDSGEKIVIERNPRGRIKGRSRKKLKELGMLEKFETPKDHSKAKAKKSSADILKALEEKRAAQKWSSPSPAEKMAEPVPVNSQPFKPRAKGSNGIKPYLPESGNSARLNEKSKKKTKRKELKESSTLPAGLNYEDISALDYRYRNRNIRITYDRR